MINSLPLFFEGIVCKGFGRGSKELGCPTANFNDDVVKLLPAEVDNGIYFGWAQVDDSPVYKMVMSVGWNPFYKNTKRSMETHIIHTFENDFYGSTLRVLMVGYVRPEKNFSSKEELIAQIAEDIAYVRERLEEKQFAELQRHSSFVTESEKKIECVNGKSR